MNTIEVTIEWPEEEGGDKVFEVMQAGLSMKLELAERFGNEILPAKLDDDTHDLSDTAFRRDVMQRVMHLLPRMVVSPIISLKPVPKDSTTHVYLHRLNEGEQYQLYLAIMGLARLQEVMGQQMAVTFLGEQENAPPA